MSKVSEVRDQFASCELDLDAKYISNLNKFGIDSDPLYMQQCLCSLKIQ